MELDKLREEIDRIDRELLSLFCRRMEVVAQVGQYKKERGLPVLNQGREDAILARARAQVPPEMGDAACELLSTAIRLSRATLRNIHENLFWAFIYNVIGIPLAAGVWIPAFGWELNPMFGAAAMSLSSFCVVSNALRLNFFNLRNPKRDKKIKQNQSLQLQPETDKEESVMEKTMKIEGMMCGHCEARVKKSLEALDGVSEAAVSHESGTAVVKLSGEVSDAALTKAVEDQDYKVLGIQ